MTRETLETRRLVEQYNSVMENLYQEIRLKLNGRRIEFEEQGFEDESSNDIGGIDDNGVYSNEGDSDPLYPIEELGFWDGIEVLNLINAKQ